MFNVGDKVKCMNYLCSDIKMDKVYTVIGVQKAFDGKAFLHLKEITPLISYDAENFIKCLD